MSDHKDYYVTPREFLYALEKAFVHVYLDDRDALLDERRWHPGDMAANLTAIIQSIDSYTDSLISQRVSEQYKSRKNKKDD